jgi:hypothetical protein
MFSMLAVLVYILGIGFPLFLLYRFGSAPWYWHALAIVAALAMGLAPTPPSFQGQGCDLATGFFLVCFMVWGIGGIVVYRPHVHKHA